jgi:hypothetical protein
MDTMRKLQPVTDQLRLEADNLPLLGPKMRLGAAAIGLKLCVSCSSKALEYCDVAKQDIAEGIKQIDVE